MSRFKFEVATPADDQELREIIAQTPTPGSISVSFAREPSFFAATAVEGEFCQVITCRDTLRGRLAGFGIRSVRQRYVNGSATPIGYLSGLRALPDYRSLGLVARGYHFFRELHQDGRTALYLTTIAEDNRLATTILTSGRAGLPRYHSAGRFLTRAVPIPRRAKSTETELEGARLDPAPSQLTAEWLDWIQVAGSSRNFFPVYRPHDFFGSGGSLPGLQPQDLWCASRHGDVVGMLGSWNQQSFRQTIVQGYGSRLQRLRPLYNAWQALRGQPGLPAPGQALNSRPAVLPLVPSNDARFFGKWVSQLVRRLAGSGTDCLLVGLHESDPLAAALASLPGVMYTTRLFLACWDDGEPLRQSLDDRPLYLELGSL